MRLKMFLLITLIAAWAVLNTGTYVYYVNGNGSDPAVMNPILALASLVIGTVVILAIGVARGFDRTAWRWNVGPFAIAILGIAFWQGMSFILAGVVLGIGTWVCVSLLKEDHEPTTAWQMFAVNTALSGALIPFLGWWLEGVLGRWLGIAFEGPVSFLFPFLPAIGAFALAYWGAWRPDGYTLDDLLGHRTKPGML